MWFLPRVCWTTTALPALGNLKRLTRHMLFRNPTKVGSHCQKRIRAYSASFWIQALGNEIFIPEVQRRVRATRSVSHGWDPMMPPCSFYSRSGPKRERRLNCVNFDERSVQRPREVLSVPCGAAKVPFSSQLPTSGAAGTPGVKSLPRILRWPQSKQG